jgi:hypothetical protein
MIYPNAAKDLETLQFPYAELFRDLSAALCRPNGVLVTYGYGFGDDHINRVIRDIAAPPGARPVAAPPASLEGCDNGRASWLPLPALRCAVACSHPRAGSCAVSSNLPLGDVRRKLAHSLVVHLVRHLHAIRIADLAAPVCHGDCRIVCVNDGGHLVWFSWWRACRRSGWSGCGGDHIHMLRVAEAYETAEGVGLRF